MQKITKVILNIIGLFMLCFLVALLAPWIPAFVLFYTEVIG